MTDVADEKLKFPLGGQWLYTVVTAQQWIKYNPAVILLSDRRHMYDAFYTKCACLT